MTNLEKLIEQAHNDIVASFQSSKCWLSNAQQLTIISELTKLAENAYQYGHKTACNDAVLEGSISDRTVCINQTFNITYTCCNKRDKKPK